ncbi:MAG: hypothetical protein H7Y88_10890 [Phycisphaerales bacterium]|nr:hypothetical protein [Phycisphaerales bacterium]
MRWLLDILAVLTLLGLLAGAVLYQREKLRREAVLERAATDVRRLELEVKFRAVTKAVPLNDAGWPLTIDPAWFGTEAPRNSLLPGERAWMEVAADAQAGLQHPPVRMAVHGDEAAFWYNPRQGVVRARVPSMVSDAQATETYNRVNGTGLRSIFEKEEIESRPPGSPAAAVLHSGTR